MSGVADTAPRTGPPAAAALELGRELGPDDLVVVLIPDSGRGYLSRIFDPDWMAGYGFVRGEDHSVADVLETRGASVPPLVYVHPDDTGERAVNVMGVDSVGAAVDRIERSGGTITVPRMAIPGVGWVAYALDTEGNAFGVFRDDPQAA